MYIPSYFKQEDKNVLVQYIRDFPFGILVTAENNIPWATHIPFVLEEENNSLVLYTHISAANPQGKQLLNAKVLAIFREPHAYISPSLYNSPKNVPTWNYIAVHAYGKVELIEEKSALMVLQEKMINMMEPAYMEQFRQLPEPYLDDLLKGIIGLKIVVDDLYGKEKLSQNKKEEEVERIGQHLSESEDAMAKKIGVHMLKKD
jgi:transcriptional regulator